MRRIDSKKMTTIAILTALAIILSYLESLIPSIGIPGIKLGLANVAIIMVLYLFGFWQSFVISIIRVLIVSLLTGNFLQMGFFMSLSGAILSIIVMYLIKTIFKKFSVIGVSIFGSILHVSAQIAIASLYLGSTAALYYYPILLISSLITGIIVGVIVLSISKTSFYKKISEK